jgi:prepilin signal peptidase PulO-like enzyme (type II secretory pathway)
MAKCPRCDSPLSPWRYYVSVPAGFYSMRCKSCGLKVRLSHGIAFLGGHMALIGVFVAAGYLSTWSHADVLTALLICSMVVWEVLFWMFPGARAAEAVEQ